MTTERDPDRDEHDASREVPGRAGAVPEAAGTPPPSPYGMRFPKLRTDAASEAEAAVPAGGGLRLRVAEAPLADVDKGFARLDSYHLRRLGLQAGMAVAIEGDRQTVAIAQAAAHRLQGRPEIQIDGMLRENAGAVVGEQVTVAPIEASPAKTVLIAPLDPGSYGAEEIAAIRTSLTGRAAIYGDRLKVTAFSRRGHLFKVAGTEPEGAVVIGPFTDVRIKEDRAAPLIAGPSFKVKYEDIGGLEEELLRVRELVELPLKYPVLFARLNIEPPKGVLLYGPPGSGKTLIARAVASEVKAHFIHVNGPEIMHKFYGESEAKLREIFEEAQRRAPTVIFLDEIDAIAPKRADVSGDVEKRVVAQLLASMDGLVSRGEVVVIAATNLPEAVDPALRRPGRFDREIALSVPSRPGRLRILQIHSRGMPLAPDVDLERLAEVTHGFVGADLEALCKEAGMLAVRDCLEELDATADGAEALAERTLICERHFMQALRAIEPTATREFALERPNVRWEDIGGIEEVKRTLLAVLELPRRAPGVFEQTGLRRPSGFLLSGPSGTGKTLTVKALATETGLRLITVDPASVFSKWVGESEKALRQVFKKARQAAPCILFFDGLDGLVPASSVRDELDGVTERLASQFSAELDELVQLGEVTIVAATNRPERVEPGLLRPGRFGFTIRFALPDARQREEILAVHLRGVPHGADVQLAPIAAEMDGFTGADIAGVCQRALLFEIEAFVERHGDAADSEAAAGGFHITAPALRRALEEHRRGERQ